MLQYARNRRKTRLLCSLLNNFEYLHWDDITFGPIQYLTLHLAQVALCNLLTWQEKKQRRITPEFCRTTSHTTTPPFSHPGGIWQILRVLSDLHAYKIRLARGHSSKQIQSVLCSIQQMALGLEWHFWIQWNIKWRPLIQNYAIQYWIDFHIAAIERHWINFCYCNLSAKRAPSQNRFCISQGAYCCKKGL